MPHFCLIFSQTEKGVFSDCWKLSKFAEGCRCWLFTNHSTLLSLSQVNKEDNLNILDRFGKTVGCEAAQSTIKLFKSSHYGLKIKVFWFICLLVACSLAGFFVIQSLIRFVTFEVNIYVVDFLLEGEFKQPIW